MPESRQNLQNLKGEITFRSKLARQHTTGEMLLPDYFSRDDHDRILADRIDTTRSAFEALRQQGIDFSLFVELGAERAHRSLVLASSFSAHGIAMDISLDQLRTATHFSSLFGLPSLPLRVCCDANHLPLRDHTVPFAFCYQFLHHFPALPPILGEIHRTLAPGGLFFFDEEPLGRRLQARLYHQTTKEYSRSNLRKGKLLRWLESFISETSSDEVEHGIIENHSMRLPEWQHALSLFDHVHASARTLRHLRSRVTTRMRWQNLPNFLLGGVISGTCRKGPSITPSPAAPSSSPADWLGCPACHLDGTSDHPPLQRLGDEFICTARSCRYPVIDDIPILIPLPLRRELYPQY